MFPGAGVGTVKRQLIGRHGKFKVCVVFVKMEKLSRKDCGIFATRVGSFKYEKDNKFYGRECVIDDQFDVHESFKLFKSFP